MLMAKYCASPNADASKPILPCFYNTIIVNHMNSPPLVTFAHCGLQTQSICNCQWNEKVGYANPLDTDEIHVDIIHFPSYYRITSFQTMIR